MALQLLSEASFKPESNLIMWALFETDFFHEIDNVRISLKYKMFDFAKKWTIFTKNNKSSYHRF